jgi:DNA-binding CsgD family transcriptional regulator
MAIAQRVPDRNLSRRRAAWDPIAAAASVALPVGRAGVVASGEVAGLASVTDACDALDRMDVGVVLLDAAGTPCFVNRYAAELLRAKDGLSIGRGGLHGASRADTERLRQLLVVGDCARAPAACPSCVLRRLCHHPLAVRVVPLGSGTGATPGAPRFAVFIRDPDRDSPLDEGIIAETFRLTRREATVAALLAAGRALPEIAATMAVAESTARTHLKRIYQKIGCRNQADLVRVILRAQV